MNNVRVAIFIAICLLVPSAIAQKKEDKSVHHAAMHAEHWVNKHSNPHKHHRKYPHRGHKDKSVHHAAMHAEHWTKTHLKPRHKHGG